MEFLWMIQKSAGLGHHSAAAGSSLLEGSAASEFVTVYDASFWIGVATSVVGWAVLRVLLNVFLSPGTASRTMGLIHAFGTVVAGFGILFDVGFWHFPSIYIRWKQHAVGLSLAAHVVTMLSVGYFVVDSIALLDRRYLKHHVMTVICWLAAAVQASSSLIHGCVIVSLFELGAILVQASRFVPNSLVVRFMFCVGYSGTRLSLAWYYGFVIYTLVLDWGTFSVLSRIMWIPVLSSLFLLLSMNAKWASIQWSKFFDMLNTSRKLKRDVSLDSESLYDMHQQIIGNTDERRPSTEVVASNIKQKQL